MDNVLVKLLPFKCQLTFVTTRRLSPINSFRYWLSGTQEDELSRELLQIEFDSLTSLLKSYFDNYLEAEFQESIYSPFDYVSLTSTDRRLLKQESEVEHDFHEINAVQIIPEKSSNLRKRRGEVYNVSKRYDGVAVFSRDGNLPIPSSNFLQSKQLQAHADEFNTLLYMLRSASPNTGLDNVASVTLSVDVNSGDSSSNQQTQASTNYDFIITVAVIVAGCSMILLAFALFLAFRRRAYHGARPMVQTKKSSPRTDTDISPRSAAYPSPPPVQVMEVRHEADDNISDYTESVFSLPPQTKQKKIKESLSSQAIDSQSQNVSSRFNPRYIISSKRSGDESENSRDDDASIGIPNSASIEPKTKNNSSEQKLHNVDHESTGLYPADIIDDDITSSLSAYVKGVGLPCHNNNLDDGVSLSSAESYGFSLDGVGDQSTFANSTKYGY